MNSRGQKRESSAQGRKVFSLLLALFFISSFATIFYKSLLSENLDSEKKAPDYSAVSENLIIEQLEKEKQAKIEATRNPEQNTERFTFYKTLEKGYVKPVFDPSLELKRGNNKAKSIGETKGFEKNQAGRTVGISSGSKESGKSVNFAFTIQLGSFNDFERAEGLTKQLKKKGYKAFIVASGQSDSRFKVRLGRFKEVDRARSLSKKINLEENLKSVVMKEERLANGIQSR